MSFLKGGILTADGLTTVSTTYAQRDPDRGARREARRRPPAAARSASSAIINGIDYAVWNPTTDPAIAAHYDAEDTANKGRCKSALLQELGLEMKPERPLLVSLGRIVQQKGCDVLAAALPKISEARRRRGDRRLRRRGDDEKLRAVVAKSPERAAFLGAVPEPLTHRLFAAADAVMIPSRYEPCGLVQLYAQRYGAAPIATRTGGLVDTIVDLDSALETGTGYLFDKATPAALVGAVQRAVSGLGLPRWSAVRRRMMRLDLGWDRPARRYVQIYRDLGAGAERTA